MVIKFWDAIGGRKFTVMIIATVLLWADKLDSMHWLILACAYIGINIAQDWILKK